ncbi:MAG: class I SAM-dependent methyltransferase [Rhodospirillaceae bacterium]|nr:class I SAM-dependent methyltransferase [Rhodospirillales bacterium]
MVTALGCRCCGGNDFLPVVDLGQLPLANRLPRTAEEIEARYPLAAVACRTCRLVQLTHAVPPALVFADYPYFSSYSSSWVEHARRYAESATGKLGLTAASRVIEVASNDGYLLRHFQAQGIPMLGIEPSDTVAAAATAAGIPTRVQFFGRHTALSLHAEGLTADLLVANNVLAHVPDLHDFVAGLAVLLAPQGVATLEFPHLLRLVADVQFDTIYHEHYSYFSLLAAERVLSTHGLAVFDVEQLPTHGGSLRLWVQHRTASHPQGAGLARLREDERLAGLHTDAFYENFSRQVAGCMAGLRTYLTQARQDGRRVAAYGAAAKGATLLGCCGAGPDTIAFVADLNPAKQGRFLPGTGIPIVSPEHLMAAQPDDVLILPWNLAREISGQLAGIRAWGGRLMVPLPDVQVLP